ncbi:hypothetical protein, partial [Novipirellula aureliae]|uniref:hypothetical protein n=1 Tax=Novipirellula aureliae TaxID=2527966 RepID=UPI001E39371A
VVRLGNQDGWSQSHVAWTLNQPYALGDARRKSYQTSLDCQEMSPDTFISHSGTPEEKATKRVSIAKK